MDGSNNLRMKGAGELWTEKIIGFNASADDASAFSFIRALYESE